MTNQEAAEYYVRRAQRAEKSGDLGRASYLYHTAAFHDPNNMDAQRGMEAGAVAQNPPPLASQAAAGRGDPAKRSWWKKATRA